MAYQFQVKGGSQKPWKQQLMLALEKQATLSYQRAHPESLKKQAEQDTEAALRRRRFGIAMTIVGAVLAVIGLMDLKEQWVVALVSLPFLAWGIAHLLPKPKYRGRYRRAAKILTKQRQNMPVRYGHRHRGSASADLGRRSHHLCAQAGYDRG